MVELRNIVGLFGTAGESRWRDLVIDRLEKIGIPYFNPIVDKWTPERAPIEAEHLATDRVILFVITGETESFASLAETGWAALSAAKNEQDVVFVIQDTDDDSSGAANRARTLVKSHAERAGITTYENIDIAIEAAIIAFNK